MSKQAVIFGATGAVGSHLLKLCLGGDRYQKVIVVARRAPSFTHAKLDWIEIELEGLDDLAGITGLVGGDAYCCLGTTIKAAGSQKSFHQVDFDLVLKTARFAKKCGVMNFNMVSSIGADANSNNFYLRTKGEAEAAVIAENLPSLRIFRPSLLRGKRDDFRLKEELSNFVSLLMTPLFLFGLRKYQPIEIEKVARALYETAGEKSDADAVCIYESDSLQSY